MTTEPNADVKRVAWAIYHAAHPKSGEWHWLDSAKQKRFVRQARAAIAAMPDREVTVQESARVLHKELISRLPVVQAYNDPIISSLAEFYTVSGVVSCFVGDKT